MTLDQDRPKRFWWWGPWKLTNPLWPPVWRGCDEWGRNTIVVQPPLLGAFIFAGKRPTCAAVDCDKPARYLADIDNGFAETTVAYYCTDCARVLRQGGETVRLLDGYEGDVRSEFERLREQAMDSLGGLIGERNDARGAVRMAYRALSNIDLDRGIKPEDAKWVRTAIDVLRSEAKSA